MLLPFRENFTSSGPFLSPLPSAPRLLSMGARVLPDSNPHSPPCCYLYPCPGTGATGTDGLGDVPSPPSSHSQALCWGYWELLWLWRDAEFYLCPFTGCVNREAPELWALALQNCYPAPGNVPVISSSEKLKL